MEWQLQMHLSFVHGSAKLFEDGDSHELCIWKYQE